MYEVHYDYKNARAVHYNRWSDHRQVNELVSELVSGIESRKKSGYIFNMKVLVLDLFHSYLTDPEQYLSYYRDKNRYDFKKRFKAGDRYVDNPHISYDCFVGSVKLLIAGGFITNKPGGHFYSEEIGEYGFLPKMRNTPKLVALWSKYGLTADMIGQWKQEKNVEVIFLKAKTIRKKISCTRYKKVKGVFIKKVGTKTIKIKKSAKYADTVKTNRMRRIVHAYNRLMDNTNIDCDAACISDKDRATIIKKLKGYGVNKEPVIRLRLGSNHVYRVFNDGDKTFTTGGRYYGAWWIGCPGELRKYITLNGKATVELDYSGVHIHLLYALKSINYAAKKEDPYTLDDGIPDRDFNKLILLTALNAENETKARDSVYDQLRKDKRLIEYNLTTKEPIARKLKLLKEKHAPIAEYIASGMGLKLQYYDSCIIEKLIEYAIRRNIPILTVHDSVICEAERADLVKDKMWSYFSELINEKLGFTIRYTSISPHAQNIIKRLAKTKRKYKLPSSEMISKLPGLMRPDRAAVKAWLTPDELINIKMDTRSNVCSKKCSYSKRFNMRAGRRRNLRAINIELVTDRSSSTLKIID